MDKLIVKLPIFLALIIIIFSTFFVKPVNYGDGPEYNTMLESIYSHQRFSEVDSDREFLANEARKYSWENSLFGNEQVAGFFQAKDGEFYSYHFWLYSLNALPVRIFTGIFDFSPLISFQIFNSIILLVLTLLTIKLVKTNKIISVFLVILNFSFWFIHWNHPEYWSYALVMSSLLLYRNKNYQIPILLSAIASTQNPPIIFLTALFAFKYLYNILYIQKREIENKITKIKFIAKQFLRVLMLSLVAFTPYVFYYIYFGTPNLISKVGGTDFSLISFKRLAELFFDPGIGIFVFQPVVTLVVFSAGVIVFIKLFNLFIKSKDNILKRFLDLPKNEYFFHFALFIVLLVMLSLSSSTLNWNHGSSGPSRYVIWSVLPIGLYFIVSFLENNFDTDRYILNIRRLLNFREKRGKINFQLLKYSSNNPEKSKSTKNKLRNKIKYLIFIIILLGIIYSSIIFFLGGFLVPNGRFGNGGFNIFQRIVLDYTPSLYNPTHQIFKDRAECNFTLEGCKDIWIYYKNDKCRKVLVGESDIAVLNQNCGNTGSLDYCSNSFCYYSY